MQRLLLIAFTVTLIAACGKKPEGSATTDGLAGGMRLAAAEKKETNEPAGETPASAPRMLVYNGTLRLQVDDIAAARTEALAYIENQGGYVSNEADEQQYQTRDLTLTVRIPQKQFTAAMEKFASMAKHVETRRLSSDDVMAEYIDNEARLKVRLECEKQLYEVLKRANTVTDIMAVQQQLRQIREEIESAQGRLKYLRNQADYSTITLTFFVPQPRPDAPRMGFWSRIADGLGGGWQLFVDFVVFLFGIWPFVLLGMGGVWAWRWFRKRKKAGS